MMRYVVDIVHDYLFNGTKQNYRIINIKYIVSYNRLIRNNNLLVSLLKEMY